MSRRARVRAARWFPPILYMAVIFYVSAQSNPMPELTARVSDKLLHLAEYAVLGVLWVRALAGDGVALRAAVVVSVVLTSAYGATDEYHQSMVPGRHPDIADWIIDTLGASIGAAAYVAASRPGRSKEMRYGEYGDYREYRDR